jgi:hypothetical protein
MKTFTLNFNEQQLQVLSAALVELPFKTSAPIIQHINAEIQKQFDKAADAKDDEVVTTN